ncbi:LysE family translocator [Desulfatitalea tepidiphila]|uniref:LysE family translocator n=1 Tax=Desulfatitalea tepidiphila TaxID=1185843 RepID=UPI0006B4007A|nr:LysE family transporter [Desulfatitalea tepidiphila]
MLNELTMGMLLGLSAGLSPGPLLALVMTETLAHGTRAGLRVALAPLVTDAPIILVTVFILARLSEFRPLLGIVSLAGGLFVCYLGVSHLRVHPASVDLHDARPLSLFKGIVVNFLSPHPYLFWLGVGAPTITRAMAKGPIAPLAFIVGFYLLLVGSKVALAVALGKSGAFLTGRWYLGIMRLLGGLLIILGILLFREGLRLL